MNGVEAQTFKHIRSLEKDLNLLKISLRRNNVHQQRSQHYGTKFNPLFEDDDPNDGNRVFQSTYGMNMKVYFDLNLF